jgi:hypothetical protein
MALDVFTPDEVYEKRLAACKAFERDLRRDICRIIPAVPDYAGRFVPSSAKNGARKAADCRVNVLVRPVDMEGRSGCRNLNLGHKEAIWEGKMRFVDYEDGMSDDNLLVSLLDKQRFCLGRDFVPKTMEDLMEVYRRRLSAGLIVNAAISRPDTSIRLVAATILEAIKSVAFRGK